MMTRLLAHVAGDYWPSSSASTASCSKPRVMPRSTLAPPDIVDSYGRVWVWKDRDLFVHDDTIAATPEMIAVAGLPQPGLADRNPNYHGLCAICRGEA